MKIARQVKYLVAASSAALALAGPLAPNAAAESLAPLYNAAQTNFLDGNESAGLAALGRLLVQDPTDTQALALQAIWSDYTGDVITREVALTRLGGLDARMAEGTRTVLGAIAAAVGTLPNPLPALIGPHTGIVVLGYGLLPDGTMRPELVGRLTAAWVQAIAAPWAPVVVTGGNPQGGVSEAAAMAGWLIGHGIPAERIHVEERANSTVQNALFGTRMLRAAGADSAVVVTSPNHIRRAVADFIVAGTRVVGATTSLDQIITQLPPPNRAAQRGIYLDATRTFLLPAAR
ncbi:YdcF family protein [Nocardia sp. CDC159]|uniref:YdcF family protein n=1 Tax=Nocardia pulmonis TaxID=2951408 RepID=A0A9X2E287_9NOCA|nr:MULTISPECIES: YdcF family protein [Nocardia]MCM6772266.1 YdcF family protein [Nocardia pulmonis]MCM6785076.1 YdcF family protein [Nocardia sp. CDC159]